ncbi:capping protein, Arp2/3 and myosin-I linker protein 2 [Lampris incognitus]|uniref:capping protein, Arp2/3 and myosin-I linker protein 2 n=1 Tax=Lampris incognitus TaxID=2546036 RepID=UPI0024B63248|nr:capping protein, Arp2/3 and myosin-I linker protein 2 [Lampris incognitus]
MASGMDTISPSMQEQISELLKPHRVCLARTVGLNHSTQPEGRSESRVLVLSPWRGYLIINRQPARVESSFSFLEISSINIFSLTQVVFEMDSQTLSFSVSQIEDLETMISHMTTALKKIFPDSSPRKLLKKIPSDIQDRIYTLSTLVEEQLDDQPASCGGFSDTYAALCDFNETPCRQEIQWDVDNIFYVHNCQEFNLLHFSHLESKDLALAVAALSFNQWFTRIYSKELKLSADIQQQLVFLLSRSPCLEELSLEASGLKLDFAIKAATALREHASSSLHSINLSANPIEDKGVIALSQELGNLAVGLRHLSLSRVSMSARGLGSLCQVLSTVQLFSDSLTHLDLSGNPGSLATEEATPLFRFLSSSNSLSFLDLSGTECPLDTLFVSLSAGCCSKLSHLNLAKNPFSLRKVQKVTRSIQEFFSQSCSLKYVGLSATRLPPQALKLLLQGLAINTCISGLELDIKSCELRSAGAQVIQEHIFEATAISSLDISDNGFESDMVTLILSLGRCQSLRHLALGRNFSMKSRALTDVLQRIAQLVQEEECPLESLSVCDSKLKAGTTILINSLGSSTSLTKVDISGNAIGNTGAKMLAKALLTNTKLRTVVWDRNNITARGFQDVADALERNFTLQEVTLPLADVIQSYRSSSDRTEEALHKEPVSETENEANEGMGRVDEGVEEFFTKKIIPDYVLKGRWEESNPAEATPSDSSSTPSVPAPLSPSLSDSITSSTTVVISSSALPSDTSLTHTKSTNITSVTSSTTTSSITSTTTTPPSKNIKKKFGDFFAFKRARAGRASKAGGGEGGGGGGGEGAKVKRTSIADLIRPLREAKERERERERERDKEREKERGTRSVEDVNVSNDATMTEGTVATDDSGDRKDKMAMMTPPIKATAPSLTTTFLDLTTAAAATTLSNLEEEVVTSLPVGPGYPARSVVTPPMMTTSTEWEKSRMLDKERMMGGGTPDGERRLKVARRSLREGKSQSLILLTGLEPNEQNKRHASEGTSSFEQKLQVMLHKMGVAKTPPADTKASQSKEEELRKANSEGAILDKPEPTSIFIKPRTMSTSSDTRRPQRAVDPFSSDPPLHPKPPLPERPAGPLPPKPVLSAKPPLPIPAASAGGGFSGSKTAAPAVQQVFPPPHHLPSSAHGTRSQAEARPRPSTHEGKAETDGSKTQIENQQEPLSQAPIQKDGPAAAAAPPAPSPRRGASAQHRSEKAQSATDESLPKPHPRLKPLPQRRAVSVHEDAFAMTQELKAVLQRSPIRHRDNRADLPTCTEDTPTGEEVEEAADRGGEPGKGKKKGQEKEKLDKSKMEKGRTGEGEMADNKSSLGEEKTPVSAPVEKDPNSTSPGGGQKPPLPLLSVTPALEKAESTRVKSPVMAGVTLPASGATCLSPTLEKVQVMPSQGKSPSTNLVTVDVRNSTQEKKKTVLKQHITEPPDQRTDAPVSK